MNKEEFYENRDAMSESISKAHLRGGTDFQAWFNKAGDEHESAVRGSWDFAHYFASAEVCKWVKQPEDKICLEIGYGGGRLLNASRHFFKHSHGVDVHPFAVEVAEVLLRWGPERNFTLHRLNESVFPLDDGSIDYAYSFIVIQHIFKASILESYLSELKRVVKAGGVINLYFADIDKYPEKISAAYIRSRLKGFLELDYPPDGTTAYNTLWVSNGWMQKQLELNGFSCKSWSPSYKGVPDGYPDVKGTQTGVIAVREG